MDKPKKKTRPPVDWAKAEGVSIRAGNRKKIAAATRADRNAKAKKKKASREDVNQAAARIVRQATDN